MSHDEKESPMNDSITVPSPRHFADHDNHNNSACSRGWIFELAKLVQLKRLDWVGLLEGLLLWSLGQK